MTDILKDLATNVTSITLVKETDDVSSGKADVDALKYAVLLDTVSILTSAAQEIQDRGDAVTPESYLQAIKQVEKMKKYNLIVKYSFTCL